MGNLFEQKYPNNIRTVSGLVNVPFQDDSILECNTTLGAVAIQLLDIPTNFSTQYKLYIVDKNNNASVNNITVTAPVGYLINGASSFVINSNNASLLVRVSSPTNYVGQYSAISGVAGHIIADESVNLPQQPILDFIGSNVTVTNGVGRTIVTISGSGASIIDITNANLIALIIAGNVVAGQFYRVTDVLNADEGVVVQGIRVNSTTTVQGSGIYLNADYQGIGNYSGVAGFVAFKGMWNSILPFAVVVGDVVIYQNIHYKNISGVYSSGDVPSAEPLNWQPLPKLTTNGYMREVDFVKYSITTNKVRYRADGRLNEVDDFTDGRGNNSLLLFQWGRNNCIGNKLRGSSLFLTSQSSVNLFYNDFSDSQLTDNTPNSEAGSISNNSASGGAFINFNFTRGFIQYNSFNNGTVIDYIGQGFIDINVSFRYNTFNNGTMTFDLIIRDTLFSNNQFITNGKFAYYLSVFGFTRACNITHCLFSNNGQLQVGGESGVDTIGFDGCEISDNVDINIANVTKQYNGKKYRKGYSNWEYTLTPLDFALGVLTIPIGQEYNGLFTISGLTPADIIMKIVNASANHRSRFVPLPTQSNAFFHTPIAGAVANDMVSDAGVMNTLIGRLNGCDFIEYERSGDLNQRTNIVINA